MKCGGGGLCGREKIDRSYKPVPAGKLDKCSSVWKCAQALADKAKLCKSSSCLEPGDLIQCCGVHCKSEIARDSDVHSEARSGSSSSSDSDEYIPRFTTCSLDNIFISAAGRFCPNKDGEIYKNYDKYMTPLRDIFYEYIPGDSSNVPYKEDGVLPFNVVLPFDINKYKQEFVEEMIQFSMTKENRATIAWPDRPHPA